MTNGKDEGVPVERTIIEDLLACSTEDWAFEDHISGEIHDRFGIDDVESIFALSMGIVVEVLQMGWMYPVFFDEEDPFKRERLVLESWDGDTWAAVRKIEEQWREKIKGHMPSDVVWFGPTTKGYERGTEVLRREGWPV